MPQYVTLPGGNNAFPLLPGGDRVNLPNPAAAYTSSWRVAPVPSGAAPVLAGTRQINSPVSVSSDQSVTSGSSILPILEEAWFWFLDGTQITATPVGEVIDFPEPIGATLTMRHWWRNAAGATLGGESNALVTLTDSTADAFPALWPVGSWDAYVDARSTDLARYMSFRPISLTAGNMPDPTKFSTHYVNRIYSGIEGVYIPSSTEIDHVTGTGTAKETPRASPRNPHDHVWSSVWHVRLSDGATQNATASDYYHEIADVGPGAGTPDPNPDFASLTHLRDKAYTEAIAQANTSYPWNYPGFSNAYAGHSIAAVAMGAYLGNSSCVTKVVSSIKNWLGGGQGPRLEGDYPAQHEMNALFTAFLALRTAAVKAQLNSTEEAALELLIEGGMYTGAYEGGQNLYNKVSMNGRDPDSDHQTNNPNLSSSIICMMSLGVIHFGLTAALAKFAAFDKSDFGARLAANGLCNNAKQTYADNRKLGTAPVPTESQMSTWLHRTPLTMRNSQRIDTGMHLVVLNNWKSVFGASASGAEVQMGGKTTVILPGVHPGYGDDSLGSLATYGRRNDVTSGNESAKKATIYGNGQVGQIKEMHGGDGGGYRSSCTYSQGSITVWTYDMLALIIATIDPQGYPQPTWWDWRSDACKTHLERARRGYAHYRWACGDGQAASVGWLNYQLGAPNGTWNASSQGVRYRLNATYDIIHVALKWAIDSDIIAPLGSPWTHLNDFPDFAY